MGTRHRISPRLRPFKPTFLATTSDTIAGANPSRKGGFASRQWRASSAKTFLGRGDFLAEIGGPNPIVGEQFIARAVQHELAGLEHVTAVGQRERLSSVLLHEQDG